MFELSILILVLALWTCELHFYENKDGRKTIFPVLGFLLAGCIMFYIKVCYMQVMTDTFVLLVLISMIVFWLSELHYDEKKEKKKTIFPILGFLLMIGFMFFINLFFAI